MKLDDAIAFVGGDYGPTPFMATNIIFRFVLNLGAGLACWVPLSLFCKNRELAGAAMVLGTAVMNFYYGINSVIWPNNDIGSWFNGHGWCDIQLAMWTPLETLNAAAICAVMQNIANQVSLMRASSLTTQEKRRKHMIQALIIFPIPLLQIFLYYFTIGMRYNISGVIGCQAVFQANWVFLVFFLVPCPAFAVAAAYYAALTWWRYRQIDASSRRALYNSGSYGAQARSARVRRKLYLMALTIVAPYCPMQLVFLFNNLRIGWPWSKTYDLAQLHAPGWAEIDYAPSTTVPFVSMYINYLVFLEVVVFFVYFGGTMDAHEMYRKYLRFLGLAEIFPSLNEKWQPSDRPPTTFKTLWPRKKSSLSSASSTESGSRASSAYTAPYRFKKRPLNDIDDTNFLNIRLDSMDLDRATATLDIARLTNRGTQQLHRSPGSFLPTNIAVPKYQMPKLPKMAVFRSKTVYNTTESCNADLPAPITPPPRSQPHHPSPAPVQRSSPEYKRDVVPRVQRPIAEATASEFMEDAHSSVSAAMRKPGMRISDYAVRRDFSSAAKEAELR